jgi:chromosome segregation ATPase
MENIYIELDKDYGDLKEYDYKWNSILQTSNKTKKTYQLQEILEEYDNLYSVKEDLESQVDELTDKINELRSLLEDLEKKESEK